MIQPEGDGREKLFDGGGGDREKGEKFGSQDYRVTLTLSGC